MSTDRNHPEINDQIAKLELRLLRQVKDSSVTGKGRRGAAGFLRPKLFNKPAL